MKMLIPLALLLSSCSDDIKESDEAAIANQAESLERAANATTDQLIRDMANSAQSEDAAAAANAPPATENP